MGICREIDIDQLCPEVMIPGFNDFSLAINDLDAVRQYPPVRIRLVIRKKNSRKIPFSFKRMKDHFLGVIPKSHCNGKGQLFTE